MAYVHITYPLGLNRSGKLGWYLLKTQCNCFWVETGRDDSAALSATDLEEAVSQTMLFRQTWRAGSRSTLWSAPTFLPLLYGVLLK